MATAYRHLFFLHLLAICWPAASINLSLLDFDPLAILFIATRHPFSPSYVGHMWPTQKPKTLQDFLSHRILWHMYEVLNIYTRV